MKTIATPTPTTAPLKRPFNLTLSTVTVEQARHYTSNLSATVEGLLEAFVAGQARTAHDRQNTCDAVCAAWNDYRATHGSFADEHCRL